MAKTNVKWIPDDEIHQACCPECGSTDITRVERWTFIRTCYMDVNQNGITEFDGQAEDDDHEKENIDYECRDCGADVPEPDTWHFQR